MLIKKSTKKPIKSHTPGPPNLPKELERECRHGTKILLHECDKCIVEFTDMLKEYRISSDIIEQFKTLGPNSREVTEFLLKMIVGLKVKLDRLEKRTS